MPMQRWLKVKGKPHAPVTNPWAPDFWPPRFAGKRLDAALMGGPKLHARYRDVEELIPSHQHLLKAIDRGDLTLLGKCEASSLEEAEKLMAVHAPVAAQGSKKGNS